MVTNFWTLIPLRNRNLYFHPLNLVGLWLLQPIVCATSDTIIVFLKTKSQRMIHFPPSSPGRHLFKKSQPLNKNSDDTENTTCRHNRHSWAQLSSYPCQETIAGTLSCAPHTRPSTSWVPWNAFIWRHEEQNCQALSKFPIYQLCEHS